MCLTFKPSLSGGVESAIYFYQPNGSLQGTCLLGEDLIIQQPQDTGSHLVRLILELNVNEVRDEVNVEVGVEVSVEVSVEDRVEI